eukprot:394263-Pyramimonas_sp.AAC.1
MSEGIWLGRAGPRATLHFSSPEGRRGALPAHWADTVGSVAGSTLRFPFGDGFITAPYPIPHGFGRSAPRGG